MHILLCSTNIPLLFLVNYRDVLSTNINWVRLGHRSLEDLLKSMKDILTYTYENGQMMVKAIPKEASAHISEMVAEQKLPKIKNKHKDQCPSNQTAERNEQHQNGLLPTPNIIKQNQGNPMENFSHRNSNQSFQRQVSSYHSSNPHHISNQTSQRPVVNNHSMNQTHFYQSHKNQTTVQNIVSQQAQPQEQDKQFDNWQLANASQSNLQVTKLPSSSETSHQNLSPNHYTQQTQNEEPKAEAVKQPSRPRPGVDLERLRQIARKKLAVSQGTCTEPVVQSDKDTQTVETSPVTNGEGNKHPEDELFAQMPKLSIADGKAECLPYEASRQIHSRASTEPSMSLPTLPSSPTTSPETSRLTCISRLGNTTFVRVIPSEPFPVNRSSQSSNRSTQNAPVHQMYQYNFNPSFSRLICFN